mgnify:FL=1
MSKRRVGELFSEVEPFPEMLSPVTDPNLEVFQITTDLDAVGNSRGGFFTPDGSRFIFGRGREDRTEYTLCEVDDGFKLRVLTSEAGATRPVVTPDCKWAHYLVDETADRSPRVVLKRISLEDFRVETLTAYDKAVDGIGRVPRAGGRPVSGSKGFTSLRADGMVACAGFNFYDEDKQQHHFAPVFINLETLAIHGFDWEPYSWRVGGQYYRGDDPRYLGHLMMNKNYRSQHWDENGKLTEVYYNEQKQGATHVVDEQGNILGTFPFAGDDQENSSHSEWRGGLYEVVTHSGAFHTAPHWRGTILTAPPIDCPPEQRLLGRHIPGAKRVELTRKITRPDVCHMSWHQSGKYAVCDTEGWHGRGTPCLQGPAAFLWLATVIDDGKEDPYVATRYLLHPRSSWHSALTENCQVLSPRLDTVFFNSDWTCKHGRPQVFCVRGFTFPESA